ncbi:MFS transporter [Lusitaniella coriacea LEGE 07157]|uniref:MFS transporter n=1 Tax=Lusitaniella coriacea LEGE 07157 TaxID=945747 RepID=A0A8J7IWF7_9CYAN|nr:MFS transporter [Lusitaniella coriacea]MBE9118003.1 MFS transporter [Lusitaniella coriacea LEGE 07157]
MQTFIILWVGQIASAIGSSMTYFALTLWVWQQTESATAIALILFFYQLPQIAISLFSGILVDRVSRKHLLILSDTGSACCTLSVGILAAFGMLQLWHIYLIAAIIGCFGNVQALTYSTTVPLIVPPQHHARASSMGAMVGYGAGILAPALAGILYPTIGLLGITLIDMGTFGMAILALFPIQIPQIDRKNENPDVQAQRNKWRDLTFGFRYIASNPSLLAMVIAMSAFAFLHQMGETLYQPMILARTGGDTRILGIVVAASGMGGVAGAIAFGIWGGFKRRVFGLLFGFIGTGLSKLLLGLGQLPVIWGVAQFGSSFHSPLIFSSYMAVWYAKVAPELQGRVLAADYLIGLAIGSSASLSAGLLADRVFEPIVLSKNWFSSLFHPLVGATTGSGISLLYVLNALCLVFLGIGSFAIHRLRNADTIMPDDEAFGQ